LKREGDCFFSNSSTRIAKGDRGKEAAERFGITRERGGEERGDMVKQAILAFSSAWGG